MRFHVWRCIGVDSLFKGTIKYYIQWLDKTGTPWGTRTVVVLHSSFSMVSTDGAFWASWWSSNSIILPSVWGFRTQWVMQDSSHQAFSWNLTPISQSYFSLSLSVIHLLVPLKLTNGFTHGTSSANKVSWTFHQHLSKPELPPGESVLAPLVSYVGPLVKVNGSGVWSTLATEVLVNWPM